MAIFSSLVVCVVYICIFFVSVSISQARDLRPIGYGVVNKEDSQDHTTIQNPSKSPEKTKTKMTIMPSGDNASTKMKMEDNIMNDTNDKKRQGDDDHYNGHQNSMKIRAKSIFSPSSNPKGKSSTTRVANKTKRKFPQAMVSWRVPRSKKKKNKVQQQHQQEQRQQQQQPLFDLDYAPPKVHPPTHN